MAKPPQDYLSGGQIQGDGDWGRGAGDQRPRQETPPRRRIYTPEEEREMTSPRIILTPEQQARDRAMLGGDSAYRMPTPGTAEYLMYMVPGLSLDAANAALRIRTQARDDIVEAEAIQAGINNAQHQGLFQDSQTKRDEKIRDAVRGEFAGVQYSSDSDRRRDEDAMVREVNGILRGNGNNVSGRGDRGDGGPGRLF